MENKNFRSVKISKNASLADLVCTFTGSVSSDTRKLFMPDSKVKNALNDLLDENLPVYAFCNSLFIANYNYAVSLAGETYSRMINISRTYALDDFVQDAVTALWKCIGTFSRGKFFPGYAYKAISRALSKSKTKSMNSDTAIYTKVREYVDECYAECGTTPTIQDIADDLDYDYETVAAVMKTMSSIEDLQTATYSDVHARPFEEIYSNDDSWIRAAESSREGIADIVNNLFKKNPAKVKRILFYHLSDVKDVDVARQPDVQLSPRRVGQILEAFNKAVATLPDEDKRNLYDYLYYNDYAA